MHCQQHTGCAVSVTSSSEGLGALSGFPSQTGGQIEPGGGLGGGVRGNPQPARYAASGVTASVSVVNSLLTGGPGVGATTQGSVAVFQSYLCPHVCVIVCSLH